jgi:DNA-binding response OmpR family regulator
LTALRGHVLIVEDSLDTADTLAHLLAQQGYEVQLAQNRDEAMPKLQAQKFVLILMDYMMPGMSLADFLTKTAAERAPIILMSGVTDTRECAIKYGIKFWIQKPINFDVLMNIVNNARREQP